MTKKELWESYRFPLILLGGIVLGAIIGIVFGKQATVLKPLGDIFINLMFTIVVPMVFVSIATAVGSMLNLKRLGKILGSLVFTFIVTGMFAAALVLVVVNIWPPAANTTVQLSAGKVGKALSAGQMFVQTLTVDDFVGLFSRKNMLPNIVAAIAMGIAMSMCGGAESPVGKFMANLNDIIMKLVNMIMKLAPIGLGACFANLVGEYGPQLIGDYGRTMAIYYPMCVVYAIIFFTAYAYYAGGSRGVRAFWGHILKPAVTAFGTQSSCAAIPANMEACDEIGVPEDIYDIVLPLGATMHMDGSVLSSIVKIAFLFEIFGMPFTGVDVYAKAIAVSILSAFVLSGAPGGGMVGEMLIVSLFGFPQEAFPIIVTIGYLVDPMATCLNSSGDTVASMMISRMVEGKGWMDKKSDRKTDPEKAAIAAQIGGCDCENK
ncbi:dicarboxylate/amino acid:cation symporter [Acidaminococcus massiliensis]|uniref:dicarboxylate/amino acid:cation symporter n=1 Tax=Acidaminococcus massiliensis TaxID=1852375 RepID=UPI0026DD5FF7|nr:dicarboxylate/amino acid:cation symporter [Acidaminococcus massiliensis]